MKYRGFDTGRDALGFMESQWLLAGERVVAVLGHPSTPTYAVPGLRPDGSPKRPILRKILLWTLFLPIMLVLFLVTDGGGDGFGPDRKSRAGGIVFGSRQDCAMVRLALSVSGRRGVWVFTDRRFAFLEARGPMQQSAEGIPSPSAFFKEVKDAIAAEARELPVEPVDLKPLVELGPQDFSYQGQQQRKPKGHRKAVYHRIVLPDGSGFDLLHEPPASGSRL